MSQETIERTSTTIADAGERAAPSAKTPRSKQAKKPGRPATKVAKVAKVAKVSAPKPPKEPKKSKKVVVPWVNMAEGVVTNTLSRGVHFSSKPINTNAAPSGVRLGAKDRFDIDLVGYATLNIDRRLSTYIIGGATAARPFNQAMSVIEGSVDETYSDVTAEQRSMVLNEAAVLDDFAVVGGEHIDPRLRQLIISLPDESDFAITPLASPIFSTELHKRLRAEREAALANAEQTKERVRFRRLIELGIGGSNPQNAGRNIHFMKRALNFEAPVEHPSVRKALALHHKGVSIHSLLNERHIKSLAAWRESIRLPSDSLKSTMHTREEEIARLATIATHVIDQCSPIVELLDRHIDILGERTSPALRPFVRALLDPSLRTACWWKDFVQAILQDIESYEIGYGGARLAKPGDLMPLDQALHKALAPLM